MSSYSKFGIAQHATGYTRGLPVFYVLIAFCILVRDLARALGF